MSYKDDAAKSRKEKLRHYADGGAISDDDMATMAASGNNNQWNDPVDVAFDLKKAPYGSTGYDEAANSILRGVGNSTTRADSEPSGRKSGGRINK